MFVGFSKTIAKFGRFRLGIGIRMNKKNALWISLIIMFIAMFKLIWYMMILCGWLFYAICYGIIWCIKKIIKASRKKQSIDKAHNTYKQSTDRPVVEEDDVLIVPNEIQKHLNDQSNKSETSQDQKHKNTQQTVQKASIHTDDEDVLVVPNDIKVHLQKNSNNKKSEDQPPRKKPSVARWIIGGIFAMFAFVNGLHVSSLLLLCAAFIMFPLPFINKFFQKANINPIVAVILSIALLFVGIITSPSFETTDISSNESTQTTQSNTEKNETNGTPYSNLKNFISKYNKIAIYDITGPKKIDIQSSQYYRTEFRLPAFKNSTAYIGKIGENSIQIINYNRGSSLGSDIRIYISVDILQQAEEIFEAFSKACNPDIKKSDLKEFYSLHSLDSQYGCSINFKGISGYINKTSDGFDIMLEASPEYFDN